MRSFLKNARERLRLFLHSIRFRLTLWFVAILGVVLLIFSVFVYTSQAHDLQLATLNRLGNVIRQQADYFRNNGREPFERGGLSIPSTIQSGQPTLMDYDVLALVKLDGEVVQEIGPLSQDDLSQLARYGINHGIGSSPFSSTVSQTSDTGKVSRQEYYFVTAPITFERTVIGFLLLGSPVDPYQQLPRLLITLLLGNLAMLLVAMVGGYWLADRAMRPVKTITHTAQQISETDLNRRLNLGAQDEIGELGRTFDQMLARLQAAFERQRQFTADASHELRTPLTIVNLEANRALASRRSMQEYERILGVIQSENEFMIRLVNDLLTLARMDAGQTVLKFEELDLSDLALEAVERLAPLASRNGVTLSVGELPEVKVSGDRQYLLQLITNLVENAIKYSKGSAGKWARVETGSIQEDQVSYGWVRVEDNGPGIPAESLPHLFDRFYRVDKARGRGDEEYDGGSQAAGETAGSGLGLSIVQWIAQAHRGQVSVQSQMGSGTVFEVRMPLLLGAPLIQDVQ